MITKEKIREIATKFQTNEQNVVNEYFQHLFLSYFYQNKGSEKILFKGGTALRVIYKSPRFSEDLDFSASDIGKKDIENILISTLEEMEREGLSTKLMEAKTTSGGYLGIIKFINGNYKSTIQLEISLRKENIKGQVTTISGNFTLPFTVFSLCQNYLVGEKIQALLTRSKPRDFYDLYYILRANLISNKQKYLLEKVISLLGKSNINFEKELKYFLPKSHWAIIRDFKNILSEEIKRVI